MKVAIFDTHRFEVEPITEAARNLGYELIWLEPRLTAKTAPLARGCAAVCSFVNDRVDEEALTVLRADGIRLVAVRAAGFNHVDLKAAARLGIRVVRVPAYSPHAIAEHAVCLLLALNRKIHRAAARVKELNFSLDGLVGFDLYGKTVGVVGTGRIGAIFSRIMLGFGAQVLAQDLKPDPTLIQAGVRYVSLPELFRDSDVVSLHVPLTPGTRHLVNAAALAAMKHGVMLINTGRGALIETQALVEALKSGQIGAAGLDVYEEEENLFFQDLSGTVLQDDVLARLLTFPNVLITAHQGFLTREALRNIAETTVANLREFEQGLPLSHQV